MKPDTDDETAVYRYRLLATLIISEVVAVWLLSELGYFNKPWPEVVLVGALAVVFTMGIFVMIHYGIELLIRTGERYA